jgi:predicted kinase
VLGAGKPAVFDATGYRRVDRDRLRRIAAAHGVPVVVIWLDISSKEARRRLDENRRTGERWNVPDEDFALISEGFEPPGADEEVVRYDGATAIDDWIDRVLVPALKENAR